MFRHFLRKLPHSAALWGMFAQHVFSSSFINPETMKFNKRLSVEVWESTRHHQQHLWWSYLEGDRPHPHQLLRPHIFHLPVTHLQWIYKNQTRALPPAFASQLWTVLKRFFQRPSNACSTKDMTRFFSSCWKVSTDLITSGESVIFWDVF